MDSDFPTRALGLMARQLEVAPELVMVSQPIPSEVGTGYMHWVECHHPDGTLHLLDGLVLDDEGLIAGQIELQAEDGDDSDI